MGLEDEIEALGITVLVIIGVVREVVIGIIREAGIDIDRGVRGGREAGTEVDRLTREQFRVLRIASGGGSPVALTHDEHDAIPLEPADYSAERQTEWSDEDERPVSD